jgi:hypothetical protein
MVKKRLLEALTLGEKFSLISAGDGSSIPTGRKLRRVRPEHVLGVKRHRGAIACITAIEIPSASICPTVEAVGQYCPLSSSKAPRGVDDENQNVTHC